MGAGSMGLAAIYWARRLGAGRIVVATRTAARHDIALALGADAAVSTAGDDPEALARALPEPVDIVVEAAGKPGMVMAATQHARMGGTVLSLGMCPSPDHVVPALNAFRDLSLLFPLGYSPEDFTETLRAFDADRIRPETMVSETRPLDGLPALVEELRGAHDHLKVQIAP
jgi:(R,R)-butanediol dehydrogenase/meso-butanediol dehydrogenase/diacetyl reductase